MNWDSNSGNKEKLINQRYHWDSQLGGHGEAQMWKMRKAEMSA